MRPSELILMASLCLSPSQATAELARLEPALINLAHLHPVTSATVLAGTLNVRELPTTGARILGQLAADARVSVWGKTTDARWLVIEAGDLAGWVSREWLRLD